MNKTNQPTNQLNELQKRPGTVIMKEGDRDNNNGLIRWAKRKIIGSIMWRMLPTVTTMTMAGNNNSNSNSNKRQKIIGRFFFDDDLNNDNHNGNNKLLLVTLFSPGLPLTKVMSYLEPYDILNCIQTCKKWNIDIDKDEIWYEVLVANSSFSSRNNGALLDATINSNTNNTNTNNNNNNNTQEEKENNNDDASTMITTATAAENSNINTSKLNYRTIAIAMSRKMKDYEEVIPPKIFPKSKLNLKDVLVVIEIRDKLVVNDDIGDDDNNNDNNDTNNNNTNTNTNTNNNNNYKQLGTFCSNLTEWTEDKPGHSKYISYDSNSINCFSNIILQTVIENDDDGCEVACTNFEMSSRLIRHDTGQCIVLNNYEGIQYYKGDKEGCFMTDKELKPKANGRTSRNNDNNLSAGTIARDVCYHYNYSHIGFDLDFIMERLTDYEYKIKSFQFKLTVSKGGGSGVNDDDGDDDNGEDDDDDANVYEEEFNSMNHFLLFLEGLDWK